MPRAAALLRPFRWDGEHIVAELPAARAVFTTRCGGVSSGPFASLNLGPQTEDDAGSVGTNRARAAQLVGLGPERLLHGRQVHGTTVGRAAAPPAAGAAAAEADGQATASLDAAPLVLVADCLPVLLAADGAVAALHGGWRGLAGGILAEGVRALREVGGDGPVSALIGPGARGCCYAVGEEVHAAFAGIPGARDGAHLDLPAVARHQLGAAGVRAVHDSGLCTMCAGTGLFFSHRRDAGVTGRQAGFIRRRAA